MYLLCAISPSTLLLFFSPVHNNILHFCSTSQGGPQPQEKSAPQWLFYILTCSHFKCIVWHVENFATSISSGGEGVIFCPNLSLICSYFMHAELTLCLVRPFICLFLPQNDCYFKMAQCARSGIPQLASSMNRLISATYHLDFICRCHHPVSNIFHTPPHFKLNPSILSPFPLKIAEIWKNKLTLLLYCGHPILKAFSE